MSTVIVTITDFTFVRPTPTPTPTTTSIITTASATSTLTTTTIIPTTDAHVFRGVYIIPLIVLTTFIAGLLLFIFYSAYFISLWFRHRCPKCKETEAKFRSLSDGSRPVITKKMVKARQLILQAPTKPIAETGPGLPAGLNADEFEDIELDDLEAQAKPSPKDSWRKKLFQGVFPRA